ncbi:MAG: hypothetical protein JW760_08855 [Spirochaetales bacterium]|nr:hypothetical protein [Spirochaetales bacterium]
MDSVSLQFFGPPVIFVRGIQVPIKRNKTLALIAYLAVRGSPVSRDRMTDMLWPGLEVKKARANLRTVLSESKHLLPEGVISTEGHSLKIITGPSVTCDVREFMHLAGSDEGPEQIDKLSKSLVVYRGEFLQGLSLPECPDFDDWMFDTGQRLLVSYSRALEVLMTSAREQGNADKAVDYARKILDLDPLREDAHRVIMELSASRGDSTSAIRQFEILKRTLEREHEGPPEKETADLAAKLGKNERSSINGPKKTSKTSKRRRLLALSALTVFLAMAGVIILFLHGNGKTRENEPISIAVLPFNFLCLEEGVDRYAESFTIEMITALAEEPLFRVTPHVSVRKYTETILTLAEIARELDVRYILDGATQANETRIRFSVQLIDVKLDKCIWAEMYECEKGDSLSTQREVVDFIKRKVQKEIVQ